MVKTVRTISMDSTDGLVRSMKKSNRCSNFSTCWQRSSGRVLNVTGEPVDEAGPVNATEILPDSQKSTRF